MRQGSLLPQLIRQQACTAALTSTILPLLQPMMVLQLAGRSSKMHKMTRLCWMSCSGQHQALMVLPLLVASLVTAVEQ